MQVPSFATAQETSDFLAKTRILISAERLTELADDGAIPHYRVDDGPPVFRKLETKEWIADNLMEFCEPRKPSVPISVFDPRSWSGSVAKVPRELEPMSEWLREFPLTLLARSNVVYFLIRSRQVVYVGQTNCLPARIITHLESKIFDRVVFIRVTRDEINAVENAFIRLLTPEYNSVTRYPEHTLGVHTEHTLRYMNDAGEIVAEMQESSPPQLLQRLASVESEMRILGDKYAGASGNVSRFVRVVEQVRKMWMDGTPYDKENPDHAQLRSDIFFLTTFPEENMAEATE